jgi:hypothetical protein
MLHPLVHDNPSKLWCGPAAIALVTGQPTSVIHRLAHEDRGAPRGVKGMSPGELYRIIRRLGYEAVALSLPAGPAVTVRELMTDRGLDQQYPAIVATIDHWFVIWRGRYWDNSYTDHPIVPGSIDGDRVTEFTTWRKVRAPILPAPKPLPPSRDPSMVEAKRLAAQYGISIERETGSDEWEIFLPTDVDPIDDVLEGDWHASTPGEVLRRVRIYVDLVKHVRRHGELC